MATVIEPSERINVVHIDGLAVLKVVKHCQESLPHMVTGSLLGLTTGNGVLEITHAFPFPEPMNNKGSDLADDDGVALDGHEFQLEMMKMLREVNVDNNCVGWYQSMYLGSYSTSSLLENQLSYQTDLSPNAVVILYDPMQTAHGSLTLKCVRLTQEAVDLKTSNSNAYLDPNKIFEEIPIKLVNPGLVKALLMDVADGKYNNNNTSTLDSYDTTFDRLDLSTNTYLEKHLEFLSSWVDDLATEQNKFQYYTRGLSRSSNKYDNKRNRQQNNNKGDDAVSAADAWKSNDAPSRMESLLISNQIRNYCNQVDKFSQSGFGKLFLTSGLHKDGTNKSTVATSEASA